jgi:iron-sulfur cluster assembly protein
MITLTPVALQRVKDLLTQRGTPELGLRVGVRGGGCSGNSYYMEFCEAAAEGDETFDADGLKVFVDAKSAMLLAGTQVDFVTGLMGSGFKFNNPNVRHQCACGESFST